jgi:hypothetical protein
MQTPNWHFENTIYWYFKKAKARNKLTAFAYEKLRKSSASSVGTSRTTAWARSFIVPGPIIRLKIVGNGTRAEVRLPDVAAPPKSDGMLPGGCGIEVDENK